MRRRSFLLSLSAATLTVDLLRNPAMAIDPFKRPSPGRLKLSLAAYSMRKYLTMKADQAGAMDLFDFVDFCAKHELPGAELTSYYFPADVDDAYILKLKRHCHLRGVSVSGGAIRNDFCSSDSDKIETDVQHTKKWIDLYALLGAPAIRIFAGKPNSGEELDVTLNRCAEVCEQVGSYAAQKGVMLALENHGGVTAKAKGLLKIVKQVDSTAFGINFDSGNFRSGNDPYAELAEIAPYAINAQIKTEVTVDGEKQQADLTRIIRILKDSGYSGWVALEYEDKEE
ncbi:MAG: sugar phosphate isomerase/epimerase family protein, partial [Planctomycetota bacterium]